AAWARTSSHSIVPRCSASRPRQVAAAALPGCSTARRRGDWPPRTSPAWRPCARVSSSTISAVSPCRRAARTNPVSDHCIAAGPSSGVVVEAEGGEALGVVDPVVAHLDEQEQVDAALQHRLQLAAGAGADGFDPAAALAEHDRALAGAAHIDDLVDADAAVLALLPRFGLDRRGIGQFVMQLEEHLLARDLGG